MLCEFKTSEVDTAQLVCIHCGRTVKDRGRTVKAICRAVREQNQQGQQLHQEFDSSCLHRSAEPIRSESCQTCKGNTEVSVYQCAVHGECTIFPSALTAGVSSGNIHVCYGCLEQKKQDATLPDLGTRLKNFSQAMARNYMTGNYRRSPELIYRLYHKYCAACPQYSVLNQACGACGCPINDSGLQTSISNRNKLSLVSESCPSKDVGGFENWTIQKANLIFYILPLKHEYRIWQWHVKQLRERLHIFNGRRIIYIAAATDTDYLDLDTSSDVIKEFGDDAQHIEFRFGDHDRNYWETPAFRSMLHEIQSLNPNEATFYFHAKGVTRAKQDAIRPWCEAIYYHNLDRWQEVKEILSVWPCCGIARQPFSPVNYGQGTGENSGWHFAGTGFWFNNKELFSKPGWDQIQDHTHSVEAYLSTVFPYTAAYCLALDGAGAIYGGVYNASTWIDYKKIDRDREIEPATSMKFRQSPQDLTICVLGHDKQSLHWATALPHVKKVYLPHLSEDNNLAESRIFHSERFTLPDTEYIGLCTNSWDYKYKGCLKLKNLDLLERTPETVWAPHLTNTPGHADWISHSEEHHPGMKDIIYRLAELLELSDEDLQSQSLWSNNFIAHRSVVQDLFEFHRNIHPEVVSLYGERPPYMVKQLENQARHLSFLAERLTILFFCMHNNLNIKQIPGTI